MEIEGKIIIDLPLQSGTSKAGNLWRKKEWVLETPGNYPRKVKFHVFGDRVDNLNFEVGKNYAVSVDVESREFNGKWYTDLNAYAAREVLPQGAPQQMGAPTYGAEPQGQFGAPAGYAPGDAASFGMPGQPTFTNAPVNSEEDLPF